VTETDTEKRETLTKVMFIRLLAFKVMVQTESEKDTETNERHIRDT